jgi:hypothetical protein
MQEQREEAERHLVAETPEFKLYKYDFGIFRPGPIQECYVAVGKVAGLGATQIDLECK